MSGNFDVHNVSINLNGAYGGTSYQWGFKVPAAGGVASIISASAVNGASQSASAAYTLTLLKYSSAGTPVVNGTVAAAIGGTAAPWTLNLPKAFVITQPVIGQNEWLVVKLADQGDATDPVSATVSVSYVMGA